MRLVNTIKTSSRKTANKVAAKTSIYDIAINDIEGNPIKLSNLKGKKLLFVNVASKCGFTGQYASLQELYNKYQEKLMIIACPCNQYGKQESGDASQIQSFCERNYGVTFLVTEKINVRGSNQHPLYQWLTNKEKNGIKNSSVKWNFQKYLVDEQGEYIDFYFSTTKPTSSSIVRHLR
ncbi:glutathione peroxidase [Aquimarina sp. D1M17]|uniref:glutathione peroxidase n=1 Tax=Aquimarina acroporae TaxID=2937283 RepID=UPI0020BFE444|nr:glutathione peroxidase [Aquimarina acroporae]MCK8520104.1 glutathione peroxidase [Aquimarina acroporae]